MLLFKGVHLQMVDSPCLIGNVSRLSGVDPMHLGQGRFFSLYVFSKFSQGSSSFPIFKRLPPIQPPKTTKTKNPPEANQPPKLWWPSHFSTFGREMFNPTFFLLENLLALCICRSAFGREVKYPRHLYPIFMLEGFPVIWDILI